MIDSFVSFAQFASIQLADAVLALIVPTVFFVSLALIIKRSEAWAAAKRAAHEVRLNLAFYFLDAVFVLPVLGLVSVAIGAFMVQNGLVIVPAGWWLVIGTYPTVFMAIFLGDFMGYWRHRLEHTRWLWPTHAIHHSDEEMTWLTLNRFHPINRITTVVIDSAFLVAMGLPVWAVIANSLVRNYYGYFIHADLPWTYGPLGKVFVSPAMHQWHHAKDIKYAGTNFATVFSIFDRVFGTFALPGPCTVPLGIAQDIGDNVPRQLAHPFREWFGPLFRKRDGRDPTTAP
jgi:sterol desaturase/sphingolipid hydroxylase (fatty acid hydroxylase superfamily)